MPKDRDRNGKKAEAAKRKDNIPSLRAEAEDRLARIAGVPPKIKGKTPEEIIHELQVYQVELELQNEELRKTQLALEETRDKYIDLYDFAPVGYFTFSREALIVGVNLTGAELLGTERSKLINSRFRRFVVPEDHEKWDRHLISVFGPGAEKKTCDLQIRRADGSLLYVRLESRALREAGEVAMFRTAMDDISERRKTEEKAEHLASFPQLNPNPVIEITLDGRVTYFNPATTDILKSLPMEEDAGIFLPADLDIILKSPGHAEKEHHFYREKELAGRSFAEYIYVSGKQKVARIYAVDITERKRAENVREKLISELKDAIADVKQLSGLLPICASCKKIRDDKGYWNQIESYITEHSEALFTHGMCPDCYEKATKELEEFKKKNRSDGSGQ